VMRQAVLTIAASLFLAAAAPSPSTPLPGWMSGDWVRDEGRSWTEEHWSGPRAGLMLGTGRSGRGETVQSFEYMRIARDAQGRLTFWGSPGGAPAVAFPAVETGPAKIVFENPAHDFPTRIVYSRTGDRLTASISGPGGANAQSWVYRRGAR
jgi:hypothetical protein